MKQTNNIAGKHDLLLHVTGSSPWHLVNNLLNCLLNCFYARTLRLVTCSMQHYYIQFMPFAWNYVAIPLGIT